VNRAQSAVVHVRTWTCAMDLKECT